MGENTKTENGGGVGKTGRAKFGGISAKRGEWRGSIPAPISARSSILSSAPLTPACAAGLGRLPTRCESAGRLPRPRFNFFA